MEQVSVQNAAPSRTKMLVLCALFTALIAVGAFLRIPIPLWPFTLQFLFSALAPMLLGRKWGTLANVAYIVLGLIGLPIFTGGGGLTYVLQPTFGCILGFAVGAAVSGTVLRHGAEGKLSTYLLAGLSHMTVVYGLGMLWFYGIKNLYLQEPMGMAALFWTCFVPTIGVDVVKCVLAAMLAMRLKPILQQSR